MANKTDNKTLMNLKALTKSSVWDVNENDIFRMWEVAEKDSEVHENTRHFVEIIRSAFTIEEIGADEPEAVKKKYEELGYKVSEVKLDENKKVTWALKKKPIARVTDLTYENIRHISAAKLIEVLDRNFGGGWDSISQSIKDIIESGFDISTTTLPQDRLHKAGGMYEKKVKDGFEVLEIPKGTWVEAIFAKEKPEMEKPHMRYDNEEDEPDEELTDNNDTRDDYDDDGDDFDEDKLTEESYRTTFETDPEDLTLDAVDTADEDEGF